QWMALRTMLPLLNSVIMLLGMVYVMARLNGPLALVALSIFPVLLIIPKIFDRHMGGKYTQANEMESATQGIVQEVLTALRVVKAFGREDHEQARFAQQSKVSMKARVKLSMLESAYNIVSNILTATGTAVVLYLGVHSVLAERLTVGELLIIMAYLGQFYGPLTPIGAWTKPPMSRNIRRRVRSHVPMGRWNCRGCPLAIMGRSKFCMTFPLPSPPVRAWVLPAKRELARARWSVC